MVRFASGIAVQMGQPTSVRFCVRDCTHFHDPTTADPLIMLLSGHRQVDLVVAHVKEARCRMPSTCSTEVIEMTEAYAIIV